MPEFSIEVEYLPQKEAAFETEFLVRVNFVPHNIMSQAGRDAGSESVENCDIFALFAPRDELPTIGGGVGAREQPSSHPNLPDTGNESEPEHDSSQPANESVSGEEEEEEEEVMVTQSMGLRRCDESDKSPIIKLLAFQRSRKEPSPRATLNYASRPAITSRKTHSLRLATDKA